MKSTFKLTLAALIFTAPLAHAGFGSWAYKGFNKVAAFVKNHKVACAVTAAAALVGASFAGYKLFKSNWYAKCQDRKNNRRAFGVLPGFDAMTIKDTPEWKQAYAENVARINTKNAKYEAIAQSMPEEQEAREINVDEEWQPKGTFSITACEDVKEEAPVAVAANVK